MDDLSLSIGKRIREKRNLKKWKQKDLLNELGDATNQMLSGWEKGHSIPSAFYLIKLAEALDTTCDYLLTGKEEASSKRTISTYEDACECLFALDRSGLFKSSISMVNFNNKVELVSFDETIANFLRQLKSLEGAISVLGEKVFNEQAEKLLRTYDCRVKTSSRLGK